MIRASIITAIVVAAIIAFLQMPTTIGAGQRRALAVTAVQLGAVSAGAELLKPLAGAGDAIAQNDLGVLLHRGIDGKRDPVEAARLLNAAAAAGLARAQLNLLLIRTSCKTGERDRAVAALMGFAQAGDRRAASIAADCLQDFVPTGALVEETRQLLALAAIATATSNPDEELKFGWLLLKRVKRLGGYGSAADSLKPRVAQEAARYLFRAAEHGRPAAYEAISQLAVDSAPLLAGDPVAARVAARSSEGWIELAAQAGHPRSRCAVGVALATRLSADKVRASDADRQRLAELFQTCLKDRDPRQIVFKDGREQTIGHYRLFDVWMKDEAFLIVSPHYDNYDHDIVKQEAAVRHIAALAGQL
jgi:TPR repeat protein